MGHRHSGTSNRAKTAPFQLSFHTLIFRCFVLIPSLCLLSASFFSFETFIDSKVVVTLHSILKACGTPEKG